MLTRFCVNMVRSTLKGYLKRPAKTAKKKINKNKKINPAVAKEYLVCKK